ncbi:hypothetical protein TSUD_206460 [Trifolium subterraneum]|uniref:Uncharacterized protein n=1 Tax=Trifolium subterraneum TaxID=3900 RepID=A0A2Z6NT40_TRISU|nr:hypothetical protein TSUD_206460 [Trifolium subterraneum]
MEDAARNGNFICFAKQSPQKSTYDVVEKAKMNCTSSSQSQPLKKEDNMNKGAHVLIQKMKGIGYDGFSLVYVDIVDKFFGDINSEFTVPQPSVSFKSSKERLGPIQLYKR